MSGYADLVRSLIDYDRVKQRLDRLPVVSSYFPLDTLRTQSTSPFACHFLALRLARYRSDAVWDNFERLLELASDFPKFECEIQHWQGPDGDYDRFFSLLWQLQVAEFLHRSGASVSWRGQGPDIEGTYKAKSFYVECYFHNKLCGIEAFIEDVLTAINADAKNVDCQMRLQRAYNLRVAEHSIKGILENLLTPLAKASYLEECRRKAEVSSPVEVSSWPRRARVEDLPWMSVVMRGSGDYRPPEYIPGIGSNNAHGDPASTLRVFLREGLRNKSKDDCNSLSKHRPNALFINCLSTDHQTGFQELSARQISIEDSDFRGIAPNVHMVVWNVCGVDSLMPGPYMLLSQLDNSKYHPLLDLVQATGALPTGLLVDFLPPYRRR